MPNTPPVQNPTQPTSTPQPANTPPPPQSAPQPAPKNKTPWLLVFVIVLLLSATGVLGYKYYEVKQQLDRQLQPTPIPSPQLVISSPSPVVSPATEVDPTAGWKTYISKEASISIKHPMGWFITSVNENSKSFRLQNYDPATAEGRDYIPGKDKDKYALTFYDISNEIKATNINQLKASLNEESVCYYIGDPAGKRISTNEFSETTNSIQIFSRKTKCSESSQSSLQQEVYLLNGTGNIIKIMPGLDTEYGEQYLKKIYSTVKF